jgi:hypothetical protein
MQKNEKKREVMDFLFDPVQKSLIDFLFNFSFTISIP